MSFKGNILTIGTGIGKFTGYEPYYCCTNTVLLGLMLFWDLRACKFLESTMNSNRAVHLKASRGWVVSFVDHCTDFNFNLDFSAKG